MMEVSSSSISGLDINNLKYKLNHLLDNTVRKRQRKAELTPSLPKEIHKKLPEAKWSVTNLVCTARLDRAISIFYIMHTFGDVCMTYIPYMFPVAFLRRHFKELNFYATISIFESGELRVVGVKIKEQAILAIKSFIEDLQRYCGMADVNLVALSFSITNVVAHAYLYHRELAFLNELITSSSSSKKRRDVRRKPFLLDLTSFHRQHPTSIYDPSLFRGLSYKCPSSVTTGNVTAVLFQSGSINIMGRGHEPERMATIVDHIAMECLASTPDSAFSTTSREVENERLLMRSSGILSQREEKEKEEDEEEEEEEEEDEDGDGGLNDAQQKIYDEIIFG